MYSIIRMNYQRIACSGGHSVDGSARLEVRRVVFIAVCGWSGRHERRLWSTETAHRVRRRVVHAKVGQTTVLIDGGAWSWGEDWHTQIHTHRQTDRR